MKRKSFKLCVFGFLFFIILGCLSSNQIPTPTITPTSIPTEYPIPTPFLPPSDKQDTVDAFWSIVHSDDDFHFGDLEDEIDRIIENFDDFDDLFEQGVKEGGELDVNDYFSVLTHLSMETGYVLDYVYFYGGLGGEPILYARQVDQEPYLTYTEYKKTIQPTPSTPWEHQFDFMNHIQVDGTADGFFEFVVLRLLGAQFYLYWHGGYNDTSIICDQYRLYAYLDSFDFSSIEDPNYIQAAYELDPEPIIEFQDTTVTVKIVTYSCWGGFTSESIPSKKISHILY